jgi:pyruvate/2-oxoglutarate dehydrogenase complex dihydrolipoamide dehydrogenase (E3) component
MTDKFDVVAIGTGSAASAVTSRCREAGWRVAIVDSRPFGGTCALRGCDPKKVLVGAAEAVDWIRRMKGKGIQAPHLNIDWPELMHFKRGEVINIFALAIRSGIRATDLRHTLFAYPTSGSNMTRML